MRRTMLVASAILVLALAPRGALAQAELVNGQVTVEGGRIRVDFRQAGHVQVVDNSVGSHPFSHRETSLEWHERLHMLRFEPVEVSARLASEVQQVFESLGRNKCGVRAFPLEQRVRGNRCAVRESREG